MRFMGRLGEAEHAIRKPQFHYSLLALIRRVFNPPLALIRRFCGRYAFLGLYNYHVEKSCIKTGGKVKSFRRGLTW